MLSVVMSKRIGNVFFFFNEDLVNIPISIMCREILDRRARFFTDDTIVVGNSAFSVRFVVWRTDIVEN